MTTGILLAVAALAFATAFGLYRRRTDGRLRTTSAAGRPGATRMGAEDGDESASGAPSTDLDSPEHAGGSRHRLSGTDLGQPLGERATLVAFSTAFCAPCRTTRVVLQEVAAMIPGVTHVEVDAESHLELVRRLDVRRTPTVLVLDAEGTIVRRAAGAPRRADVIAALGDVL